jgi:hypothetical protein
MVELSSQLMVKTAQCLLPLLLAVMAGLATFPSLDIELQLKQPYIIIFLIIQAFSPKLFKVDPAMNVSQSISALCAVGSQDCGISFWWTAHPRSLAVINNLFSHSIMDMCWYDPTGFYLQDTRWI